MKKCHKLTEKQFEEENVNNFINFLKVLKTQNSEAKPEGEQQYMQFASVQERVMDIYHVVTRQENTFGTIVLFAKHYIFANKLLVSLCVRLIQTKLRSMKV